MPEYVEGFFVEAAEKTGLQLEPSRRRALAGRARAAVFRADDLARCEALRAPRHALPEVHLPQGARAAEPAPRQRPCSPGHPLFAAVDEVLDHKLEARAQGVARFLDPFSPSPYRLHFYEVEVEGGTVTALRAGERRRSSPSSRTRTARSSSARRTSSTTSHRRRTRIDVELDEERGRPRPEVRDGAGAVPDDAQSARGARRGGRDPPEYLEESFDDLDPQGARALDALRRPGRAGRRGAQARPRQRAARRRGARAAAGREARRAREPRRRRERARSSTSAPRSSSRPRLPGTGCSATTRSRPRRWSMCMAFEREQGWEPTDVSKLHDGSGFDIRSVGPDGRARQRAGASDRGQGPRRRRTCPSS